MTTVSPAASVDEALSNQLHGARVVVTGGCGTVGSSLVQRLVSYGADVVAFDSMTAYPFDYHRRFGVADLDVSHVIGDLRDVDLLHDVLRGTDLVIHAAAYADVAGCTVNYREDFESNVLGTMNVLDAARDVNPDRLLFVSSASLYGDARGGIFEETMAASPLSTYANSKLWGENQAMLFFRLHGLRTTSVRYFSVYGEPQIPKEGSHSWCVAIFAMQALKGVPITIYGDGRQVRDFTYIDDIATGTLLALVRPETIGARFNLGTGVATPVLRIAELARSLIGDVPLRFLDRRADDPLGGAADTVRLRELLGWQPEVTVEEGVARYTAWLKANADLVPDWL